MNRPIICKDFISISWLRPLKETKTYFFIACKTCAVLILLFIFTKKIIIVSNNCFKIRFCLSCQPNLMEKLQKWLANKSNKEAEP